MTYFGYLLYALSALFVWMMWRKIHSNTLNDLLDRSAREHQRVHDVFLKRPQGGTWRQVETWLEEEDG